ncbi:hypothetical protein SS50377_20671 [Spironucleus salmonicida]|uniref:Uncharacterized protein n=1 Tax=Spironucleus salmonicida TaxID=348837 RepID=V6LY67_9EUKA|nr:hypothetical protein SS50377_28744 [Spironucleus salmonicida]KAH0577320.1 hypothetical protein SS50377_20671 [Spironucleus salmonicida]|eukprot:EST49520.1 Hypothetical protein SS50377_10123 [Spironucleus salmonicida]
MQQQFCSTKDFQKCVFPHQGTQQNIFPDSDDDTVLIKNIQPVQLEDYLILSQQMKITLKQRVSVPQQIQNKEYNKNMLKCSFQPRIFHNNPEKLLDARYITTGTIYDENSYKRYLKLQLQVEKQQKNAIYEQDFESCQFKKLAKIKRKLIKHK